MARRRATLTLPLACAGAALLGCSNPAFQVDAPLRATPPMPVSGEVGFNVAFCPQNDPSKPRPPPPPLLQGKDAEVRVGSLHALAGAPHRAIGFDGLVFGKATLADLERLYLAYKRIEPAAKIASVAAALATGNPDIAQASAKLDLLYVGLRWILSLPRLTTETTTFTVLAENENRTIVAVCGTTEGARTIGYFDGPRTSLTCRIVSSADGVPRDLRMTGTGTWADYAFVGALEGQGGAERADVRSQNVTVLGMGAIRGFEVRAPEGGEIGAISFWELAGEGGKVEPRAWQAASPSAGATDAVRTALAIAYVFPWPTGCDDAALRNKAWEKATHAL